jgi:tetratricopeptide (TPR) repeat protein
MFRFSTALACFLIAFGRAGGALSEPDTVYFLAEGNSQGWVSISGELLSFSRAGVTLRDSSGIVREFRGRTVLRIETQLLPEHREGVKAYWEGHFEEALTNFRAARAKETRPWVVEELIVRSLWCLRYLGRHEEAFEEFALLLRGNSQTTHWASIPLAWIPGEISATLERRCLEALRSAIPELQLVGASYLLGGRNEAQAVPVLERLSSTGEEPLRTLAWFQLNRVNGWRLTEAELKGLENAVDRLPRELRPGPVAVLAQAWEAKKAYEQALLWWLHLPICFPEYRDLAAWGLLNAGRDLERLHRPADADQLYRELLENYPEFPYRHLAEARLAELQTDR